MLVSAPSSNKTSGPTLYEAPFAQSNTTFNPVKSSCFGSICLTNSAYLPLASSILLALPKFADFAKVGFVCIFNCISFSTSSFNLNPSDPKSFNPLSS